MSIRVYQGPHSDGRRMPVSWQWVPWLFAGVTIGGQMVWLLAEPARDLLTIATVVTFFLASLSHAWLTRGWLWALGYVVIASGVGAAMEPSGSLPDFPLASTPTATPSADADRVPVVVMMAWAMMAYPAFLAAQRISRTRAGWLSSAPGSWPPGISSSTHRWSARSLDLDLAGSRPAGHPGDPAHQLRRLGHHRGHHHGADVTPAPAQAVGIDGVPTLMLAWVYFSNVLANAVFFDRPWVAVWGGVIMGAVVIPWAWITWTRRP